jgi:hypothetical protein
MESELSIQVEGKEIEQVTNFCYLGSVISQDSSCEHEIKTRIGKANSNFGKLNNIWKSKRLNNTIKIRLYESLILSTLLYAAETWPMTVANMKKLEAAHHKWQRKILGITWEDRVTNEEVRRRTKMLKLELIIRKRRLRWLGHLHRMRNNRIAKQALSWQPLDGYRKRGRPRKNWRATVNEDLQIMGLDWENVEETAGDRPLWRSCVARCVEGARTN